MNYGVAAVNVVVDQVLAPMLLLVAEDDAVIVAMLAVVSAKLRHDTTQNIPVSYSTIFTCICENLKCN